jgi:hypothetical protein
MPDCGAIDALNAALAYWNVHRHPYQWKKKPQEQFKILGGYGITVPSDC